MFGTRDRVKELRKVRAGDLIANPKNFRKHPTAQKSALRGILAEIGNASAVIAYETPQGLTLIDGHLRADLDPDAELSVLVLDVDDIEADKLLATFDPVSALAETDGVKLHELLQGMQAKSAGLKSLLDDLRSKSDARPALTLPADRPGDGIELARPEGQEDAEASKPDKPGGVFPLAIILDLAGIRRWKSFKAELGQKNDTKALLALMDRVGGESDG